MFLHCLERHLTYDVRMVHDVEKPDLPHATQDGPDKAPKSPKEQEQTLGQAKRDSGSSDIHSSIDTINPGPVEGEVQPPRGSNSRASSTRSRALSIVPRPQRRGLLGRLAFIPEVDQPHHYKNKTKWLITAITACSATAAPLGSAIFFRKLNF